MTLKRKGESVEEQLRSKKIKRTKQGQNGKDDRKGRGVVKEKTSPRMSVARARVHRKKRQEKWSKTGNTQVEANDEMSSGGCPETSRRSQ